MLEAFLRDVLTSQTLLFTWLVLSLLSVLWLLRDLRLYNQHIMPLMKAVWVLTVLYSGPLGLIIFYYSGRRQIATDSLWRKGFRSVAHCYSGCGAGELSGIIIAVGLLSLGNFWVSLITFSLAYVFGYGMTLGPLLQSGMPFKRAMIDTFYSDTATIAVMEITAISLDLWLAGDATMGEPRFWNSLILSLTVGLVAAYPVNLWLIRLGVKGGMGDPRDVHGGHHHH